MTSFKTADALATLRKAVAFIVRRNDEVMGKWHDISVLIDLCNVVAGYDENSSNMRGVDVTMMDDAFITNPPGSVCIPLRICLGMTPVISYTSNSEILAKWHRSLAHNRGMTPLLSASKGGTPIEKFGIKDDSELWFLSKDRLKQFLRKRKREDEKMKRTMVPKSSSAST